MNNAGHQPGQWRQVIQAVLVYEDFRIGPRQTKPPSRRLCLLVFDLQDTCHCLLLEPFAHVPLMGASSGGKLRRVKKACSGESIVKAKSHPKIDAKDLEGTPRGLQQAFHECISPLGQGVYGRAVLCVHVMDLHF